MITLGPNTKTGGTEILTALRLILKLGIQNSKKLPKPQKWKLEPNLKVIPLEKFLAIIFPYQKTAVHLHKYLPFPINPPVWGRLL